MRLILSVSSSVKVLKYDPTAHIAPRGSNSKVSLLKAALRDNGEPNTFVYVATEDNTNILGAISVQYYHYTGERLSSILHLGSIQSGVGTLLVKYAISIAKKSGPKELNLEAYENTGAQNFYTKLGFQQDPNLPSGKPSMIFRMKL